MKSAQLQYIFLCLALTISFLTNAQNALLWEISGNGTKKPSYLYGTMHVSNKVAFHLSDTFFVALKSCESVALESSPETWLDELMELSLIQKSSHNYGNGNLYDDGFACKAATNRQIAYQLSKGHSIINQMLYRFSRGNNDFEENTYLDLFIFQTAKKLKKDIVSLEDANEAMKLVLEGSIPDEDEEKELTKVDFQQIREAQNKLEKAYRNQDIQLIDSLNKILVHQPKLFQNLIVKRNITFANSIDSIIQNRNMFSAVGAAHLPGEEGVIELLRQKGYTLRPVIQPMIQIGSKSKSKIEKQKFNISYSPFCTEDSLIAFDIPSKCLSLPSYKETQEYICTEFVNGAYFSLIRIPTYGNLLEQKPEYIMKRIDSLLFENIPGKILKIKPIHEKGIQGYSILNKTKRGEFQRHNLYVTPLELLMFKVGAPGKFAKTPQSEKFFNSISFNKTGNAEWTDIDMSKAGYQCNMPAYRTVSDESILKGKLATGHRINAFDWKDSSFYSVIKASFHDFSYIEEDSFELHLIADKYAEQFKYKPDSSYFTKEGIYPAFESRYIKDSSQYLFVKTIIQGPHYYLLSAKTKDTERPDRFFNSFTLTPYTYPKGWKTVEDTLLHYSVKTVNKHPSTFINEMLDLYKIKMYKQRNKKRDDYEARDESEDFFCEHSSELINLTYKRFNKYFYAKDSNSFWKDFIKETAPESTVIKQQKTAANTHEFWLTDTNSIRCIHIKSILHNGTVYSLRILSDTLTEKSAYAKAFFDSFSPLDSLSGHEIFSNKLALFAKDLASGDSLTIEQAKKSSHVVDFRNASDSESIGILKSIKSSKQIKLSDQNEIINLLANAPLNSEQEINQLKEIYINAGDTSALQLAVLFALAGQKQPKAMHAINDLFETEIPLGIEDFKIWSLFYRLSDSLQLSKELFPDLLEIATFPEYKEKIYGLLATIVDSAYTNKQVLSPYKNRIKYDAKIELKRQLSRNISESSTSYYSQNNSRGFEVLKYYQSILIPFYDDSDIQAFYSKALNSENNSLKLITALKLAEHDKQVNDTLWHYLSEQTDSRIALYKGLKEIDKIDLFDSSYMTQKDFCFADLYAQTDTLTDSVQFIARRKVISHADSGYVYFYKRKRADDNYWELNYCGIQPLDESQISTDMKFSYSSYQYKLRDKNDNEKKMIDKISEQIKMKDRQRVGTYSNSYYNFEFSYE